MANRVYPTGSSCVPRWWAAGRRQEPRAPRPLILTAETLRNPATRMLVLRPLFPASAWAELEKPVNDGMVIGTIDLAQLQTFVRREQVGDGFLWPRIFVADQQGRERELLEWDPSAFTGQRPQRSIIYAKTRVEKADFGEEQEQIWRDLGNACYVDTTDKKGLVRAEFTGSWRDFSLGVEQMSIRSEACEKKAGIFYLLAQTKANELAMERIGQAMITGELPVRLLFLNFEIMTGKLWPDELRNDIRAVLADKMQISELAAKVGRRMDIYDLLPPEQDAIYKRGLQRFFFERFYGIVHSMRHPEGANARTTTLNSFHLFSRQFARLQRVITEYENCGINFVHDGNNLFSGVVRGVARLEQWLWECGELSPDRARVMADATALFALYCESGGVSTFSALVMALTALQRFQKLDLSSGSVANRLRHFIADLKLKNKALAGIKTLEDVADYYILFPNQGDSLLIENPAEWGDYVFVALHRQAWIKKHPDHAAYYQPEISAAREWGLRLGLIED